MVPAGFPSLYAAFDRFPSRRGAATHIAKLAPALFEVAGGGLLYTLGETGGQTWRVEGSMVHLRLTDGPPHYLDRARVFRQGLRAVLDGHGMGLRIAQFRDPWSGLALLEWRQQARVANPEMPVIPIIYEVNGLPSIELPSRYPHLLPSTLEKLRALEARCWTEADWILTPSQSLKENLVRLGAPEARIEVLPNGADLTGLTAAVTHPHQTGPYILYFGALQPWQGVEGLVKAFALLQDLPELRLVLCVSSPSQRIQALKNLAENKGISDRIHWEQELSTEALAPWIQHARLSVAPLTACARNLEQGCAPLKILESMQAGVPVVASDLPPVRELIRHGENGWLVRPDRPLELARAIRVLLEYPEKRQTLGAAARAHIRAHFGWPDIIARYQMRVRKLLHG